MKYRVTIVSFILCIFFMHIDSYGNNVMEFIGLQWRPWVETAFFIAFLIFKYIFVGSLFVKLAKWYHSIYAKKPSLLKKFIAAIVVIVSIAISLYIFAWELWALSGFPKEYIVIRDSKKCVACVTSWNDSSVSCHEYKGLFLMGKDTVSYEIYHRTNDPFKSGLAPYEK